MKLKKMSLFMIVLSIMLLVSACASGNQDSNTGAANNSGASSNNSGSANNTGTASNNNGAGSDEKTYRIGISQYLEHPSLDATREGFLAALKDAGIEEGVNLEVDYNTAQADSTNNNSIATKLAGGDYDLLLAIATPSAMALASQIADDTPMLFAAVTDPLDARLVDDLQKPGGNITGAADFNPESINMLMDFIAKHLPHVKNIGLIINTGEPNAVVMADHAEAKLKEHGINLLRAAVTNTSEVPQAAQSLVGEVDAFYITLDNSVVAAINSIIQVAEAEGIPLFAADRDTVEGGAVAAVGFRYYDHGYQAGQMAVEILKNGKNPGELPVLLPDKLDLIINVPAAERQGLKVTDEMIAEIQDQENNLITE